MTKQTMVFDHHAFAEQQDRHWQIEQYHRAIKQVRNIERFQVRRKEAINNHLLAAIRGFVPLQQLSFATVINTCYSVLRNSFKDVIASFIGSIAPTMKPLNPEFHPVVNA